MKHPKKISLEIDREYYNPIPAQQGDTARTIEFKILSDGITFDLDGKTVRARVTKPDGKKAWNDLEITNKNQGECTLKLTNQMLAVPGWMRCQLEIREGQDILSTIIFTIDIRAGIEISNDVESTNEFTALDNAIKEIDEWNKYFEQTSGNIEEKYTTRLNSYEIELSTKANNDNVYAKTAVDGNLNLKRDKTTPISMNDLGQDVKLAITGGSVAVVGDGAVIEPTIGNNAVIQRHIKNNQVGRLKQIGSIAEILTKDSIEINIQEGKLKIKNAPYVYTDTTSVKFGVDNTTFPIDKVAVLSKAYVIYADLVTLTIEFAPIPTIVNPYIILCYVFFTSNINNITVNFCGNHKSIKVIDNIGKEIVFEEHSDCASGFIYPTVGKQLDISKVSGSTTDIRIVGSQGTMILASNFRMSFTNAYEQIISLPKNSYLSKLYYNTKTNSFEAYNYNITIMPKTYLIFIAWFILRDTDGDCWGLNSKSVYLNGKTSGQKTSTNGSICNCLGDSITYGLKGSGRLDRPYPSQLVELCGFDVVNNYGISDSTVATNSAVPNWDSTRNPMCKRYKDMPDADVITVLGGVNDFLTNIPKGTMSNMTDTDTFYGALHVLFSGLIKKYPKKQILVITPIRCAKAKTDLRTDGTTLKQWCEIIKEVAEYYGLPVLDLQKYIGINPDIAEQIDLIPDGLHPSQEGANILARKIGKFINFIL